MPYEASLESPKAAKPIFCYPSLTDTPWIQRASPSGEAKKKKKKHLCRKKRRKKKGKMLPVVWGIFIALKAMGFPTHFLGLHVLWMPLEHRGHLLQEDQQAVLSKKKKELCCAVYHWKGQRLHIRFPWVPSLTDDLEPYIASRAGGPTSPFCKKDNFQSYWIVLENSLAAQVISLGPKHFRCSWTQSVSHKLTHLISTFFHVTNRYG